MTAAQPLKHEQRPATPSSRPLHIIAAQAGTKGVHPNALFALIAIGAFAVVGLWWKDTSSISGIADWLTNAGRITGLLAGYGVIVLLALMARVPAIERGVGTDRLARWHAMGGRYSVSLIVAHALLIIWGYALADHQNVISETKTLWGSYADVLMATVALGLFVGVGVASARAARRRLRYETWLYIHFYTYLATALAFSHQFSTGADFVNNLAARIVWAGLYITVAVLLIWYRFLTPIRQSLRRDLRIERIIAEPSGEKTIWIRGKDIHSLAAQPGQFFRWRFLTRGHWWAANPYSLSAAPRSNLLRITVKSLGDHSNSLQSLQPGTRVIAEGPYGALTPARQTQRGVVLIAGGVGITPLRALFETLHGDITLIYRASTAEELLFQPELEHLAKARGMQFIPAIGARGSSADVTRPRILQRFAPNIAKCDIYICGPSGFMHSVRKSARVLGVPRRRIHIEDFDF